MYISLFDIWFTDNNPFELENPNLRSLSSGVTATSDDINCDQAERVGEQIQEQLDNMKFDNITIKRKDQIKTLACLSKPIETDDGTHLHVSPNVLFNRLLLVVKLQSERTQYFNYPLTPEPTALFIDWQMRPANRTKSGNQSGVPKVFKRFHMN